MAKYTAEQPPAPDAHADRADRAADDRPNSENRTVGDRERLEMFRAGMTQEILPNLPKIPGYHVCWVSTQNSRDTVFGRERLGYSLIRKDDMPGMDFYSISTGDYAGCIGVKEMVAMKLPLTLYEQYMLHNHHEQPMFEADRLKNIYGDLQERALKDKGRIDVEPGSMTMNARTKTPRFVDADGNDKSYVPGTET